MINVLKDSLKKTAKFGSVALWCVLSSGCGEVPDLSISSVSIYAEPDANQNSAIAVDLVLVYNDDLAKTIGSMAAGKYFDASSQLLLDNPTLIDIWRWELVPGQIVENFEPDQDNGDAVAGFVFANYLSPGPHRIKVAPDGVIKILLLKDDLKSLSVLNVHDVNTGTTETDLGSSKEGISKRGGQAKIGPVTSRGQQTKEPAQTRELDNECSDEPSPCLNKPPVKITPLAPPIHNPCKSEASR